jgi:hypothetical protein
MKPFKQFVSEGLFGKKDKRPAVTAPKRFPDRSETKEWIEHNVAYHRRHHPDEAHHLFSPHHAAYMPNAIHTGSSFDAENKKHYHEARERHHDLVKKAMDENAADHKKGGFVTRTSVSRVNGHNDDFKHLD